jgi:hypothetical protein
MKRKIDRDEPVPRPATLGEARRQIDAIFAENKWDERDRRVFCESVGVDRLDINGARAVLAEMERLRMIIYSDEDESGRSPKASN